MLSSQILNQSLSPTLVYADWCGPCKTIAPVFSKLASEHTRPRAVTFVKVDVDSQRDISSKYSVRSMPTFMIFRNGEVINTIKGADPRGLTVAVTDAAGSAQAKAPAYLNTPGRTLGSSPPAAAAGAPLKAPRKAAPWSIGRFINAILTFLGLYFVSLFALDPKKAAEESMFNIHSTDAPLRPMRSAGASTASRKVGDKPKIGAQGDRKFATLSDLGKEE